MRALGLGHSTRSDPADAAAEASTRACEALGGARPAAAIVVSTSAYGGVAAAQRLVSRACSELGTAEIVGAALDGLMVGGAEWTGEPAVAVLALVGESVGAGSGTVPGVEAQARTGASALAEIALLDEVGGHEDELGSALSGAFSSPAQANDLILLFAEPHAVDGARAARSLDGLGPAAIVGIAAGDVTGESGPVWAGDEVVRGGLVALRISMGSGSPVRFALTQAGRPLGEPMRITRVRGHWVASLEGRSALDVYRDVVPAPLRDDLPRAARSMLVALEDGTGRRRVRNVVGFDEASGAFSVAEAPGPDDRLALVALDGAAARDELGRLETRLAGPPPLGALYLNCRQRAQALFDHEGYELGRVTASFGGCPVLGLMGSHLYGRADARSPLELHTYAALAALIDA